MCAQISVIKLYRGGTDYLINRLVPHLSSYVYLFFIISGFGMCCGYYEKIKNNEITLNNFYSKRYRKILPFFFITGSDGSGREANSRRRNSKL